MSAQTTTELSTLELNIEAAISYLDSGNEDAARNHLAKASALALEARQLIGRIGFTSVQTGEVITQAEAWRNKL